MSEADRLGNRVTITINGVSRQMSLIGTPPNLHLIDESGSRFSVKHALSNGQLVYYTVIDGENIQLPLV